MYWHSTQAPIKIRGTELQVKASLAPDPDAMVQCINMRNNRMYDHDELRKLPIVQEEVRKEEEIWALLLPMMPNAK
jgi:hypothetical protein